MEFKEYPFLSVDLLKLTTDEDISELAIHQPVKLLEYHEELLLVQEHIQRVVSYNKNDVDRILSLVRRDQVRWILTAVQGNQVMLQYCLPVELTEMPIEIGIDALITDDLFSKQEIVSKDVSLACTWMATTFLVPRMAEGSWLTVARFTNSSNNINTGFQILGLGWRAEVEQSNSGGFWVKRLTRSASRDINFSLLTGAIAFKDISVAAQLTSAAAQAALKAALRDNASYLELWQLYNDKEWQNAQREASELGTLQFESVQPFEDGRDNAWRLMPKSIDDVVAFKQRWISLEIKKNAEVEVNVEPPNWGEELSNNTQNDSSKTFKGTLCFENDYVVLKSAKRSGRDKLSVNRGWLYLSLAGFRTAAKRRLAAKIAIDSGKRLPQLKWLLDGVPLPAERRRKLEGLTKYSKESFKGGRPTEKQKLALETALNTPDVAIIIGPPGTGKTQVIAALQRRLAEEAKDLNITGTVLISSFQHDAVDNALERSDVFNLPASRVGGKGAAESDHRLIEPWLERQSAHLQSQIATQLDKHPELMLVNQLSQQISMIRVGYRTQQELLADFTKIQSLIKRLEAFGLFLPAQLEQQFEDYISSLKVKQKPNKSSQKISDGLRIARALRADSVSFSDDGPDRCWDVLRWIKREALTLTELIENLLTRGAEGEMLAPQELKMLADWQTNFIEHYLPDYRPKGLQQQLDREALIILERLEQQFGQKIQTGKGGIAWALQQLQRSIDSDLTAALAVVEEYSMIIGATCQQAASEKMANLKAVTELDTNGIEFDTVIVDEAARANPLDLFIPMSMAKRRIVLVGDDRQLPHMLEPDIEGELLQEHQLTELQLAAFKSSLFERLRLQLTELERQDSIRRVVMLDTQFRMHPTLGDFISKQFYEAVGLGQVKSGRKKEDFSFEHEFLSGLGQDREHFENKICQWINVPAELGKAQKVGTSRVREAEASSIVREVKRLLEAGGDKLSIGVITFYAAQKELIMQKLCDIKVHGISPMVKKNGDIEPHDDFKWVRKINSDGSVTQEERLRVGSVDAFQGKEFDIVLLSCVRTYTSYVSKAESTQHLSEDEQREDDFNKKFGFLRLTNRMNVAMSRQRNMLICVGDAQLAQCDEAKYAVPALAAFYQLCGGQHGSIR